MSRIERPQFDRAPAHQATGSPPRLRFDQAPAHLKHTVRKPKGYILVTGPMGVEDEGDTVQCVHCQMHWKVVPGSGRERGFCFNCFGVTCGKPACETKCVPAEKMIERMEAGARLDKAMERTRQL